MSLTVWAGAPDSFIRLDGDGVGRETPVFPAYSPPKEKGPDDNLTLSFWLKNKNPATSQQEPPHKRQPVQYHLPRGVYKNPATSYSPTRQPVQYHRHRRA